MIFYAPQKKITNEIKLYINGKKLKQSFCIKYLGILIDSHLNWKDNIDYVSRNIKRTIGIIYKLRYYVNTKTLVNVYNGLIHPFLIYGILAWGNTYPTTLKPLIILQKKATCVMTFPKFDAHSSPLFKEHKIIKFLDLVSLHITIFMHKFHNNNLPVAFNNYFTPVNQTHDYNTRLASKLIYSIPKIRTNDGIFNLIYQGAKLWNTLDEAQKMLSLSSLKKES